MGAALSPLVLSAGPSVLFVPSSSARCPVEMALVADRVYRGYFIALQWLTAPLRGTDALDRLSTGQLVGWGEVARMGLSDVVIGCGLFAILGAWLFRRRELGAAQG